MSNDLPAAKAEATDAPVTFPYGDKTYTVPPSIKWPVSALMAFEDEKIATFCRALLGPVQWTAFMSTDPDVQDISGLMEALGEASGISGN
ncbi:hypothetical protein OG474_09650 [Kribbella sp. NBC_01505]|uniref:hypothetical protein n=1 Tax=Kribbella sp. NBC_01505 TaxID=2903580 RepID=UPI00386865AE